MRERRFYTVDELDSEFLDDAVNESEARHGRILEYVELEEHDESQIEVKVIVQQDDRMASIVGFGDAPKFVKGRKARRDRVDPFHISNAKKFDIEDPELEVQNDEPVIEASGVASGIDYLEGLRANTQNAAVLAMLNEKNFTWKDGDIVVNVPYGDLIGDLPDVSDNWNDDTLNNYDPLYDCDIAREKFAELNNGAPAKVAFVNGTTAAVIKQGDIVRQHLVKQQPSDPDDYSDSFEMFMFGGFLWIPLRFQYPSKSGLQKPVADGRAIVTSDQIPGVDGYPIKLNRASNKRNNADSSGPNYQARELSRRPHAAALDMYDNLIPTISKTNGVMHWELY